MALLAAAACTIVAMAVAARDSPGMRTATVGIDITVDVTGSVSVGGKLWLEAETPRLFCGGVWHVLGNATTRAPTKGADALGAYTEEARDYSVRMPGATLPVQLAVRAYGANTFVMEQRLPAGCSDTQASRPVLPSEDVDGQDDAHPGMAPPFLSFPASCPAPTLLLQQFASAV